MVKIRALLSFTFCLFLLFFTTHAWAQGTDGSVKVTAEIDLYKTYENHPLQGTITVTHNAKQLVDEASFKMEGTPIKVEAVKSVKVSANDPIQLSLYKFLLPAKPRGLYVLPEITVSVGGKVYHSIQSTYEVTGAETSPIQNTAALRLDASVEGATPLYPGQRVNFVYRFYYTGDIELTEESLPLLEAKGFQKIGDKRVKDSVEGGFSVQEITQEVQAIDAGTFTFPASAIEGYAYQDDILGKRNYQQPKLRAEAPPITVSVLPFPATGKPESFNGAIGEYTIRTSLLTPPTVTVDDKMQLAIDISGDGVFSTIPLPELKSLSNGLFRLSDLPPVGEVQGNVKRFTVEIYPLSTAIREIPSIEFSFYDPLIDKYSTVRSNPISIKVLPNREKEVQTTNKTELPTEQQKSAPSTAPSEDHSKAFQEALALPSGIEIEANYPLVPSDLRSPYFGTWNVLWLIPLGIVLLLLQYFLKNYLIKKGSQVKAKSSEDLFKELLHTPPDTPQFYALLNKSFLVRLKERGHISSADIPPEQLSEKGPTSHVRTFLLNVEQKRFASREEIHSELLLEQAKAIFKLIS